MAKLLTRTEGQVTDPAIARWLFSETRLAWIWIPVRFYVAYVWLTSGWGKLNNPAWMQTGEALKGFWLNALKIDPRPVIYFDWYRQFIQFLVDNQAWVWFAKIIAIGEVLIGIALVLGAFTGIAAFFGAFMNWNFMMAGTASSNPLLFTLTIFLILAWKVAGYYGLDRFLLPAVGTPWRPGLILRSKSGERIPEPAVST